MNEPIFELSGWRWREIRRRYVNLCVNKHGEALIEVLRALPTGVCVVLLTPGISRWLGPVLQEAQRLMHSESGDAAYYWELGFALFVFAPVQDATRAGRTPSSAEQGEACKRRDRLTPKICSSMPTIHQRLMQEDLPGVRAILGRLFGQYFSDVRFLLVEPTINGLSWKTWEIIDRIRREVLDEWQDQGVAPSFIERARNNGKLAQEILERLPPRQGITKAETVQAYLDICWEPATVDVLDELLGIAVDPTLRNEVFLDAKRLLADLPLAERDALIREYVDGIPPGLSYQAFIDRYGLRRDQHRALLRSALAKLGRLLLDQPPDEESTNKQSNNDHIGDNQ